MTIDTMGAQALGALTPREAQAFEAHLESCLDCQREAQTYRAISQGLLHACAEAAPPPRLRAGLIAALGDRRVPESPAPRRFSLARLGALAGLLVAIGLSAAMVTQVVLLRQQLNTMSEQLNVNQTALALVAYPGARSVALAGDNAGGTVVVDSDQSLGVLIAWGLPALEPSRTYQVWLIAPDGTRTSGGTFDVSRAMPYTSVVFHSPSPLAAYRGLGVTIEPAGGSPAPTGPRVLRADF